MPYKRMKEYDIVKQGLYVSEIYTLLDKAENEEERVNVLRKHWNKTFEQVVYHTFKNDLHFFTNLEPPYKKQSNVIDQSFCPMEIALTKLYLFITGHPKASRNMTYDQRWIILIQLLESMSEPEAKAFLNMIMRKPGCASISKELIMKVSPGLFAGDN